LVQGSSGRDQPFAPPLVSMVNPAGVLYRHRFGGPPCFDTLRNRSVYPAFIEYEVRGSAWNRLAAAGIILATFNSEG
jgi:hypothetical protein